MHDLGKFALALAGTLALFGLGGIIAICAEAARQSRDGGPVPASGADQDDTQGPLPADTPYPPDLHLVIFEQRPTPYPACRRILSAQDRLQAEANTDPEDIDATR